MSEGYKKPPKALNYKTLGQLPAAYAKMENTMQYASVRSGLHCPEGIHDFGPTNFACRHCDHQDEIHPVGIVKMPKQYFLCTKCLTLLERQKLNLENELILVCRGCVMDEVDRLILKDPELYRDFTNWKG